MIANKRQYRITKAQLDRFDRAIASLEMDREAPSDMDPAIAEAEIEALQSQADDLRQEIAEYEELATGKTRVLEHVSFDQLPDALIKGRIAAGLSQKQLGEKLGLKEQQIQRYEATGYSAASISRVCEVMEAMGVKVRKDVFLPPIKKSLQTILARLRSLGIERSLVINRLISRSRAAILQQSPQGKADLGGVAVDIAANVRRIYGWSPSALLTGGPLVVRREALGAARFKLRSDADQSRLTAYTVYAHYVAMLLLEATPDLPQTPVPTEPAELRRQIIARYGAIDLSSVLGFVWDSGIPVLPLQDPGAFQGACWRVAGRNVIVLKQRTASQSRWLYDLLHELWHAEEELGEQDLAHVDVDEAAAEIEDVEEEANCFAGDVLLDGRAEELAEKCVDEAQGIVNYLKTALPRVAKREAVSVGVLANYMAFRLSLQDFNWWGTATNLQEQGEQPYAIARDILMERVDLGKLNTMDTELLMRALTNPAE